MGIKRELTHKQQKGWPTSLLNDWFYFHILYLNSINSIIPPPAEAENAHHAQVAILPIGALGIDYICVSFRLLSFAR